MRFVCRFALAVCLVPLGALASPHARIEEHHVPAPSLGASTRRKVTVVLPPGYDPARRQRYPVLFMLDGQNLANRHAMHGGWRIDTHLEHAIHTRRAEPTIIVGIHAENRMHEYAPTFDREHQAGGGASRHVDFVADDVVQFIDRAYHTRADRDSRALGGASLGGLAAMHGLVRRSDRFGNAMLFSPSVWWNNHAILHDVEHAEPISRARRVFIYNGGDHDNRQGAERLRDALNRRGLGFQQRLFHFRNPAGTHDEVNWRDHFTLGLGAIFPARD